MDHHRSPSKRLRWAAHVKPAPVAPGPPPRPPPRSPVAPACARCGQPNETGSKYVVACCARSVCRGCAKEIKRKAASSGPQRCASCGAAIPTVDADIVAALARAADSGDASATTRLGVARAKGQYFRRAVLPLMNRGAAAAATWIFSGERSRRRR